MDFACILCMICFIRAVFCQFSSYFLKQIISLILERNLRLNLFLSFVPITLVISSFTATFTLFFTFIHIFPTIPLNFFPLAFANILIFTISHRILQTIGLLLVALITPLSCINRITSTVITITIVWMFFISKIVMRHISVLLFNLV